MFSECVATRLDAKSRVMSRVMSRGWERGLRISSSSYASSHLAHNSRVGVNQEFGGEERERAAKGFSQRTRRFAIAMAGSLLHLVWYCSCITGCMVSETGHSGMQTRKLSIFAMVVAWSKRMLGIGDKDQAHRD